MSEAERARLAAEGMYRPEFESDACGVGLVGRSPLALCCWCSTWRRNTTTNDGSECPHVFAGDAILYHLAHARLPTA